MQKICTISFLVSGHEHQYMRPTFDIAWINLWICPRFFTINTRLHFIRSILHLHWFSEWNKIVRFMQTNARRQYAYAVASVSGTMKTKWTAIISSRRFHLLHMHIAYRRHRWRRPALSPARIHRMKCFRVICLSDHCQRLIVIIGIMNRIESATGDDNNNNSTRAACVLHVCWRYAHSS